MAQKLDNKEASVFRQVVRHFESKQYKRGLKSCEQILRKAPNHGETLAMKALILNAKGDVDEAFTLAKVALQKDMKSHVCWHVYGLLYRSVKNYEEAIKAYRMALRIEPDSQQILRDLALLQIQMRDYGGYCESRKSILTSRPQIRQNWTTLAVAYHLAGNLESAENVLTRYEETLKPIPPKTDLEHAEASLYKNTIIAETGRLQQAYDHLDTFCKDSLDGLAYLELNARYLSQLEMHEDAAVAYGSLLERNPERRDYFQGLEASKRLVSKTPEDRTQIYTDLSRSNPRGDAVHRIPLDFLQGEAFTEAAGSYLRAKLQKGVTSTFANVRALYSDHEKRDSILGLVESYVDIESSRVLPDHRAAKDPASTAINGDKQKDPVQEAKSAQQLRLSSLYFLAQHFNYPPTQDLTKAMKYIEQALEQETERIEYLMTKGRIVKHMGDFVEASSIMERARELDKRDRYINTKAAKYQLRSDQNEMALRTMSMFTRNEAAGGPLGDLHDMQCLWFLMEDAESYLRQERLGLALKRYTSIATIFDVWEEDQFDFHTFSLRKGMIQSYIDLVRWEDTLRQHPFYTRTALGAVRCLLKLFDEPSLSSGSRTKASELTNGMTDLSLGDQKRAAKKARNDQRKQERVEAKEREDKRIKKPTAEEVEVRKEDPDPLGKRLLQTKTPLEDALKFLVPVLELSPTCAQAQQLGYEIYQRQKQLLPALRCLAQARLVDPSAPKTHEQTCRFLEWWASAKDTTPSRIKTIAERTLDLGKGEHSAAERNARYLRDHDASAEYIHGALNVKVTVLNQKLDKKDEQQMQDAITLQSTSREVAEEGLRLLTGWEAGEDVVDAYREVAHQRWPRATALLSKT